MERGRGGEEWRRKVEGREEVEGEEENLFWSSIEDGDNDRRTTSLQPKLFQRFTYLQNNIKINKIKENKRKTKVTD